LTLKGCSPNPADTGGRLVQGVRESPRGGGEGRPNTKRSKTATREKQRVEPNECKKGAGEKNRRRAPGKTWKKKGGAVNDRVQ